MNFYSLFYLFSMADKLSNLWLVFVWISSILSGIFTIEWFVVDDRSEYIKWGGLRYTVISCLFCFFCWVLYIGTPTKKEAVLIIAGGYVGNFIQSDSNARQLPADITRFLRSQINLAAKENNLEAVFGKSEKEIIRDSLSNLSKDQLIDLVQKK